MSSRDLINELKADRDDLERRLTNLQDQAANTARVMYRRGYLAGHSAGRKNATRIRGPYRKQARA